MRGFDVVALTRYNVFVLGIRLCIVQERLRIVKSLTAAARFSLDAVKKSLNLSSLVE